MIMQRRNFLTVLFSGIVAAPAIVRASSLMPIRGTLLAPTAIIQPRAFLPGVPRCDICFGPFGMCAHTGGPFSYNRPDLLLDSRVEVIKGY
jgi:hypothetical protein